MQWTLALLLFVLQGLPPLVGPLLPDSGGTVTGIVRRMDSGGPVADAQVAVVRDRESVDQAMTRASITDTNGRFTIRGVEQGTYTLYVQGEGFFGPTGEIDSSRRASRRVDVIEGIQTDAGVLRLLPGATISGRIYGSNGEPVLSARVQALKASYVRGQLAFTPVKTTMTDDRGDYRLFSLSPGDYYIRAQYRSSSDGAFQRYGRIYFPGIPEEDAAPSVAVKAGAEMSGIDFRIPITPVTGITITGHVSGGNEESGALDVTSVHVVPRDRRVKLIGDDVDVFPNQAVESSQGKFELHNVPPGEYTLFPVVQDSKGRSRTASVLVDVATQKIEGIVAALQPGFDLSGRVTLDGKPGGESVLRDSLQLLPLSDLPGSLPLPVNPSAQTGEFTVPQLPPGKYVFHVASSFRASHIYLADVKRGKVSVFDGGLTIGGDTAEPIEVMLKSKGGVLAGAVTDPTRLNPFPYATVVLIPDIARRQNLTLFKRVIAGEDGKFSLTGIPPGEYKVYAWATLTAGAWENPLFLQRFDARGTPVTITEGTENSLLLTVIP